MLRSVLLSITVLLILMLSALLPAQDGKSKTLVLEASQIQGKIKKPQVALIAVEKRPAFKPMALASLNSRRDITKTVDPQVFENRLYGKAFDVIEDTKNP